MDWHKTEEFRVHEFNEKFSIYRKYTRTVKKGFLWWKTESKETEWFRVNKAGWHSFVLAAWRGPSIIYPVFDSVDEAWKVVGNILKNERRGVVIHNKRQTDE